MSRFLQIHTLSSYPAVLLNRDDSGLAKRLPYGGTSRIRISSQCLKRHWRLAEDEWSLKSIGAPMGWRSREIVERKIIPQVSGEAEVLKGIENALVRMIYGKNSAALEKRQAMLLGQPEIDYLTKVAQEVAHKAVDLKTAEAGVEERFGKGKGQKNLATMKEVAGNVAAGLEAALFGRMVTSDPDANSDAAIHVAHGFTVHHEESESDYFTVVDDLRVADGEAGSGGIFDTELTSGVFYGYVVVDIPLLTSNLGGDAELAAKVVEHLIHLIATVSPGAKRGSTAPYAYADLMLIECGNRQPRSLASAFRNAVPMDRPTDVAEDAAEALHAKLVAFDSAYGAEARAHLSTLECSTDALGERLNLDDAASWAARAVPTGE